MNITLRPLQLEDKVVIPKLADNINIWNAVRDYFPHPYSEKDAECFIAQSLAMKVQENFAIMYHDNFCGIISANVQTDVYRKSAEMGYWIGESFWGRGIATMAVDLICEYAFKILEVQRIFSGVFEYNKASMRVLEKSGFKKEGVLKNAIFKKGQLWDEHKFAKLKS
ncbi:MAG: ribosomal-protein-alanine N-acetyltransferase [Psychromonas sp.]|jgi:ribosomal-protein-alanine N-acetyltransferase